MCLMTSHDNLQARQKRILVYTSFDSVTSDIINETNLFLSIERFHKNTCSMHVLKTYATLRQSILAVSKKHFCLILQHQRQHLSGSHSTLSTAMVGCDELKVFQTSERYAYVHINIFLASFGVDQVLYYRSSVHSDLFQNESTNSGFLS